jgi:hypothetical protein
MMKRPKRISTKHYLIYKMLKYELIPRQMAMTMKKHFTTEEVQNFYSGMSKTRYGRKKLHRVI